MHLFGGQCLTHHRVLTEPPACGRFHRSPGRPSPADRKRVFGEEEAGAVWGRVYLSGWAVAGPPTAPSRGAGAKVGPRSGQGDSPGSGRPGKVGAVHVRWPAWALLAGHRPPRRRGQAWAGQGQPTHRPAQRGLGAGAMDMLGRGRGPTPRRFPQPSQLTRGGRNVSGREVWKQLLRAPPFEQSPKRHRGRPFEGWCTEP